MWATVMQNLRVAWRFIQLEQTIFKIEAIDVCGAMSSHLGSLGDSLNNMSPPARGSECNVIDIMR